MSIRTEKIAINAVRTMCLNNQYLNPEINDNDRTIALDGNIFVHDKGRQISKNNFRAKVPVQVKGTTVQDIDFPETINHAVALSDIKCYLNDNGCFYLVVAIRDDGHLRKYQIYYHQFYQREMTVLIKNYGHQKEKNLKFQKFPQDITTQADLLLNYDRNYKMGHQILMNAGDSENIRFDSNDKYLLQYETVEKNLLKRRPFLSMLTSGTQTLIADFGKEGNTFYVPVEQVTGVTIQNNNLNVGSGEKTYFENVTQTWFDGKERLELNSTASLEFIYDGTGKINVTIKPIHRLSQQLQFVKFFKKFLSTGVLTVNEKVRSFDIHTIEKSDLDKIESYRKQILTLEDKLKSLRVTKDLIIEPDNGIEDKLMMLMHVDGDLLKQFRSQTNIGFLNIGNLNILVYITSSDEGMRIENYFGDVTTKFAYSLTKDAEETFAASRFAILDKEFLRADNFDADAILQDLKRYPVRPEMARRFNKMGLDCLDLYDEEKDPSRLFLAKELFEFLKSQFPSPENALYELNYLQSLVRQGQDITDKKKSIENIMSHYPNNAEILMGCQILLGDAEMALQYQQEIGNGFHWEEWPIVRLLE